MTEMGDEYGEWPLGPYGGLEDLEEHSGVGGAFEAVLVPDQDDVMGVVVDVAYEQLIEVDRIDPALMDDESTRAMVVRGLEAAGRVTAQYGSPDRPKCASGTYETEVLMTYHNGGEDGHTSVGALGAGVPRNALLIMRAVNDAAGYEVFDREMRGLVFEGAGSHDEIQLCGRTLLPEGQGYGRGDERLSAELQRERHLQATGNPAAAQIVYDNNMATAWDPHASRQNVDYEGLGGNRADRDALRRLLMQEATANAMCSARS